MSAWRETCKDSYDMDTIRREDRKRTTKGDVENILQGSSSCGHHMGGMCNCCCWLFTLQTTRCCPMCQTAREELSLSNRQLQNSYNRKNQKSVQKEKTNLTTRLWMFYTASQHTRQHFSLTNKTVFWNEMCNLQQLPMCLHWTQDVTVWNLRQFAVVYDHTNFCVNYCGNCNTSRNKAN